MSHFTVLCLEQFMKLEVHGQRDSIETCCADRRHEDIDSESSWPTRHTCHSFTCMPGKVSVPEMHTVPRAWRLQEKGDVHAPGAQRSTYSAYLLSRVGRGG